MKNPGRVLRKKINQRLQIVFGRVKIMGMINIQPDKGKRKKRGGVKEEVRCLSRSCNLKSQHAKIRERKQR